MKFIEIQTSPEKPNIMLENHCEKRRNCLFQAISPFLTMFSTAMYLLCIKMWHCVVMG